MGHALVTTEAGLAGVAEAVAASAGPVGLDTETTGLDHARHQVRLLQLATPHGTFLVDVHGFGPPLWAPVFEALAAAGVVGHNLGSTCRSLRLPRVHPGRVCGHDARQVCSAPATWPPSTGCGTWPPGTLG